MQAQILALQNNPPNQINMAGIPHPYFDWNDSIPDFLAQLRLDLQNRGIDPAGAGANGRAQALGHLRACMRGRTLKWFDEEITTKTNWKLTNLTDGTGQANLVAVSVPHGSIRAFMLHKVTVKINSSFAIISRSTGPISKCFFLF